MVVDTQDEQPKHNIQLNKVGVRNLKTFVIIDRSGVRHHLIPKVEITIDLPAMYKGIHMSRLVETMTEVISDEFSVYKSVEEAHIRYLEALAKKHSFSRSEIRFDFEFGYASKTPVSKKRTWEVCEVSVVTTKEMGHPYKHSVEVKVIGNTVCPHCMANNKGITHMQRALGMLRIVGETNQIPSFGQMIEVIEKSFSSKTYSLLKLGDEMHVTKEMYDNPQFVEDLCRNMLQHARDAFKDRVLEMFAEAISLESIHKHDVIAQGQVATNGD